MTQTLRFPALTSCNQSTLTYRRVLCMWSEAARKSAGNRCEEMSRKGFGERNVTLLTLFVFECPSYSENRSSFECSATKKTARLHSAIRSTGYCNALHSCSTDCQLSPPSNVDPHCRASLKREPSLNYNATFAPYEYEHCYPFKKTSVAPLRYGKLAGIPAQAAIGESNFELNGVDKAKEARNSIRDGYTVSLGLSETQFFWQHQVRSSSVCLPMTCHAWCLSCVWPQGG